MKESFNTIANQKYEHIEKDPYKRHSSIKIKKINKNDIDYNAGPHNNDDYNLRYNYIEGGKKDRLNIFEQNFFLNKNKNSLNTNISNNLNYLSSINLSEIIIKEDDTGHADTVPYSIMKKLFNSISRISIKKKKNQQQDFL